MFSSVTAAVAATVSGGSYFYLVPVIHSFIYLGCQFNIVKLRQGSGKDGQGLVNKRPLMAPNGLKGLSTLA